jgi:Fe-S cluster biogenesis protein NfuA
MFAFILDVHPTAIKHSKRFTLSAPLSSQPMIATTVQEAALHPLLEALWALGDLHKIHLQQQHLTLFGYAGTDFERVGRGLSRLLKGYDIPTTSNDDTHLASFDVSSLSTEVQLIVAQVQQTLDSEVRPHLQKDNGDMEIFAADSAQISLRYVGACRSCGFSSTQTQAFILERLRMAHPTLLFHIR